MINKKLVLILKKCCHSLKKAPEIIKKFHIVPKKKYNHSPILPTAPPLNRSEIKK